MQPTIILCQVEMIKLLLNREHDIQFYEKGLERKKNCQFDSHQIGIDLGYDNEFRPWLGESILLSKGETWKRKRRLMSPAFHFDHLQPISQVCINCTEQLIKKWKSELISKSKNVLQLELSQEIAKVSFFKQNFFLIFFFHSSQD